MLDLPQLYAQLPRLRKLFGQGVNIMQELTKSHGASIARADLIELIYEIQAGSYIDIVESNKIYSANYCREIASLLAPWVSPDDVVLDVGTGEYTTFGPVMNNVHCKVALACDISLSRLLVGQNWLFKQYPNLCELTRSFVADLASLPLPESSVDVIWSSHALEPNHGREQILLSELFRVARKYLVLFEPYYEGATPSAQERMRHFGYVRNLKYYISELGGVLVDCLPLSVTAKADNMTHCFIIRVPEKVSSGLSSDPLLYACPRTGHVLDVYRPDFIASSEGLVGYPSICAIPLLRDRYMIPMLRPDLLMDLS
jgi:hypothetical protein